jgi:hypothetical protein
MEEEEVVTLLTWINQSDPRMQLTPANRDIWHYSLSAATYDDAKQAVLEHYRYNDSELPNPGTVRKRAAAIKSSRQAKQQALTAGPTSAPKTFKDYEKRTQSPQFIALFEEGRRQGNADRAARTAARNAES